MPHNPFPVTPDMTHIESTRNPDAVELIAARARKAGYATLGLKQGPFGTFEIWGKK